MASRQKGMTARIGPMEVDVPRTTGYYVGVGAAVAFGLIEWPVAIFIGAIPLVKMMQSRRLPAPLQFAVHLFDGASQPVGGDSEGTVRLERMPESVTRAARAVRRTFDASPLGSSGSKRRPGRRAAAASTSRAAAKKGAVSRRSSAAAARPTTSKPAAPARKRATAKRTGPAAAATRRRTPPSPRTGTSPAAADTATS